MLQARRRALGPSPVRTLEPVAKQLLRHLAVGLVGRWVPEIGSELRRQGYVRFLRGEPVLTAKGWAAIDADPAIVKALAEAEQALALAHRNARGGDLGMDLVYRSFVEVDSLVVDECTIHASVDGRRRFWHLWLRVLRADNGQPDTFCVPVAPLGPFNEHGPGGRTWGFGPLSDTGVWQVSPSINVLATKEIIPGHHPTEVSIWHETPRVVGVPEGERWMLNAP
jgi:hypothetical protein